MKLECHDYRRFRLSKINTPEFSHVKLLLFWPVYGLAFMYLERFYPAEYYYPMHCALDDIIPFNELFIFPYMFWFIYLTGMIIFVFFFDTEAFRKMMKFIIISYTTTLIIYVLFPTCQNLRPESFPRDNALSRFVGRFYAFDTNTNVCPSLHVTGSLAVLYTALNCRYFKSRGWRISFSAAAFLICISTVFLKQHSVIDILAALPLCAIAGHLAFGKREKKTRLAGRASASL